ncbi:diguanylate cyclase [Vibrio sp. SCSIO 43136]|uniref:diguanylate cyclase n=1 Tax=Vibrio sp. SCSIO 43136 TaxID=2819101 RepID=UPI0020760DD1|nr:diguanylate cyclase [Vibrio sp. SCSIO 43136]USD66162.1 diguanylate cyclase [Vibrio sp. SCSIO 43136]
MKVSSFSKMQYLPIFALALSMVFGGYLYNQTLDRWLGNLISQYMFGLVEDVIFDIEDKYIQFDVMNVEGIDRYLDTRPQSKFGRRFTLIRSDGKVLGDTNLNLAEIRATDDHSDRPEVIAALAGQDGVDQHTSSSTNQELLYVAKTVPQAESSEYHYVLRLAMPMTTLNSMISDLQWIFNALMSVSLITLVFFSWYSNRKILRMVDQERDQQESRIVQRTQEIELLHRLANMLAACNSIKEAQSVVEDIIPRILGDINGSVAILRESRNILEVQLDWGGAWPGQRIYSPDDCWALRKGKHHLSKDDYHHLPCRHMEGCEQDGVTLCVPLTAHGNTIGMFHLHFDQEKLPVSDETKQLAFTIAEHLGLALANLNLQEKLRNQALSDPLTGLFNRRYFEQEFEQQWLKAQQDQSELSLLMLDLDHFKRFNDNFGHDAGDYVLKEVSNLLTAHSRELDYCCRLGGEELAIICPECGVEESQQIANLIVEQVRELHLDMRGLSLGQLGVSIGIATYPSMNLTTDNLIKEADKALYMAKDQGRSRAIHAHSTENKVSSITKANHETSEAETVS